MEAKCAGFTYGGCDFDEGTFSALIVGAILPSRVTEKAGRHGD